MKTHLLTSKAGEGGERGRRKQTKEFGGRRCRTRQKSDSAAVGSRSPMRLTDSCP